MPIGLTRWGVEMSLLALLNLAVYWVIYFGLRHKREWVIVLIFISSALNGISCFFDIMQPAQDLKSLISKFVLFLLFLFFAYNLIFFRRKNVREVFSDKDTLVI
jgi:hypothetical protein